VTNVGLENEFVRALSAADGSTVWSVRIGKVGAPDQRPSYPGSRSMPTIDGDRLYAVGSNGDLVCLETATGKKLWHINFAEAFGSKAPRWAWAESPLVDGDKVICSPGGPDATILAVNKVTGKVIWKSAWEGADLAGYGSPVPATLSGVDQYVVYMGNGVGGVDASTGKLLWRYDKTAEGSPANILTPVISGDFVYTGSNRGGSGLVHV
jgi:outer membrane protein assembly factor BamB